MDTKLEYQNSDIQFTSKVQAPKSPLAVNDFLQSSDSRPIRKVQKPIGCGKANAPLVLAAFSSKQQSTTMSSAFEGCKDYSPIRSNGGQSSFVPAKMLPFLQKQDSQSQISELTIAR